MIEMILEKIFFKTVEKLKVGAYTYIIIIADNYSWFSSCANILLMTVKCGIYFRAFEIKIVITELERLKVISVQRKRTAICFIQIKL